MADLTFGLLALPENIENLISIGKWMHECLKTSRHASETLERLNTLSSDIYSGQFSIQLESLQQLLESEKNSTHLRLALEHVDRLCGISKDLKSKLQGCTDDTGAVRRLYLGFIAKAEIESALGRYSRALGDFQAFMVALYIRQQARSTQSDSLHLTRDRFSVFRRYEDNPEFYLDHEGHVRRAEGDLSLHPNAFPEELSLLLETQLFEKDSTSSEAQHPVEELAKIMRAAFYPKAAGVLPCLGYRTEPRTDLIFRIPSHLLGMHLESLQSVIGHNNQGRGMPVKQRLHIAYGIAAALESVHCAQLFHKSLRPETVLLFFDANPGSQEQGLDHILHPYLSSWSLLRSSFGVTSKAGTHDWTKNLYRHPTRQNIHVEQRYSSGHDIYSLGVTLLELGLWDSLISWSNLEPRLSPSYIQAAIEIQIIQHDDYDSNLKVLLEPANAKKIIFRLVSKLESQMSSIGAKYAELVNTCLTWIERGGRVQAVSSDPVEGACLFQEKVAGPLLDMRLSF